MYAGRDNLSGFNLEFLCKTTHHFCSDFYKSFLRLSIGPYIRCLNHDFVVNGYDPSLFALLVIIAVSNRAAGRNQQYDVSKQTLKSNDISSIMK